MNDQVFNNNEDFAAMLADYERESDANLIVGEKIEVKVIAVGSDTIFVDTHTKMDGCIDKAEFMDSEGQVTVAEGDVISLYVIAKSDSEIRLSKALSSKNSGDNAALRGVFDDKIPVEGKVTGVVKGGFNVDVMGKRAFCPGSLIDVQKGEDADYIGKTFSFEITKYENNGRNLVVDRKKLLRDEFEKARAEFYNKMQVGEIYDATVARVMGFGAFVAIDGGVEGLVHVSELGWSRIDNAEDFVKVGDKLRVKLLAIGDDPKRAGQKKLSFSAKQVMDSPWASLTDKLNVGDIVTATITRTAPFGAFAEIFAGVEGLVHMSEMSYTKRVHRAEDVVSLGDKVQVVVKEIMPEKQRLSLSIRDAEGDPWAGVDERFNKDDVVTGRVVKQEKFGLLIEISPGIVGLMPRSFMELASDAPKLKTLHPDSEVTVKIDRVDAGKRQIALAPLSMNDAEDNWQSFNPDTSATKSSNLSTGFNSLADKLKEAMQK